MTAREGQLIGGDFQVVRALSSGGMGAVYVAEQRSTGARRALKLMHPDLVSDAKLRERFVQEARVSSKIASDHVVSIVAAGVDADTGAPYIAMELLEGQTLRQRVDAKGPLPKALALIVFRQLFHAVAAAHDASIVHRDLKPENVFLAKARRADSGFSLKILDFGIAKLLADARTQRTAAMGTPLWMAPEQTESDRPITPAADLWALGLIAFYVLVGKELWLSAARGGSMHAVMREILFEKLPRASERAKELGGPALPPGFDDFFARTVCREIEGRFATAGDALDALERAVVAWTDAPAEPGHSGDGPAAGSATVPAEPVVRAFSDGTELAPETPARATEESGSRAAKTGGKTEPMPTPPAAVARPIPTPPGRSAPASRTPLFVLGGLLAVGAVGAAIGLSKGDAPEKRAASAEPTAPTAATATADPPPAVVRGPFSTSDADQGSYRAALDAARAAQRPSGDAAPPELLTIGGDDPRKGPANARVTVIWYGDHSCPSCLAVSPTLDQLVDNYPTDVRLVWRDCAFRREGRIGAIAGRAAFITGGSPTFWKAHQWMVDNPKLASLTLDPMTVLEAIGAGVTTKATIDQATARVDALDACMATTDGKIPTFFVNGERLVGAQPFEAFGAAVERHIKQMNTMLDTGTDHDAAYAADVRASYRPPSP
jgi:serine/threonine protein kinase